MAQMIRKQIYIKAEQDAILKKRAHMLGVTEAEVIRGVIDRQTGLLAFGGRDLGAWEREKAFISERMAAGRGRSGRRFRREDAYENRTKRYGGK